MRTQPNQSYGRRRIVEAFLQLGQLGQMTARILIAKLGLDGHDRGAKVVARTLRDAGFEVIYTGLKQSPDAVAAVAVQEDVDLVGVSLLSGAHAVLVPELMRLLRAQGSEARVLLGGIIPEADRDDLLQAGVSAIFGPGESGATIVAATKALLNQNDNEDEGCDGEF
jgi:methylmalonyl-CoA mutase, C-terminal domain